MSNAIQTIAMWVAIAIGFVALGQCFRTEQVERTKVKPATHRRG